jgi:hypothetical protein
MEPSVITAIITAGGTIIGAGIGAIISRSDFINNIFLKNKKHNLGKKLESTWTEKIDGSNMTYHEIFEIEKESGTKVYGKITMDIEPDKEWEIEGRYNGHLLQLIWYPSKSAMDLYFKDHGCYFFEELADGSFDGWSVGIDWESGKVKRVKHKLRRIK